MKTIRRRKMEGKTDFTSRLASLKSEHKRLVCRKTNRYIIAQIIESHEAQDKILIGIDSKILLSKGWPKEETGRLKSLIAAYLTGFAIGKLALEKKIKRANFDIGMNRSINRSRLYAVLKGALDAGMDIPHDKKALPNESDFKRNEKLKNIIDKIKEKL